MGVTDFVSEIKRVENYPDFETLTQVVQYGLQGFIVKNIEGESTEDIFKTYFGEVGLLRK